MVQEEVTALVSINGYISELIESMETETLNSMSTQKGLIISIRSTDPNGTDTLCVKLFLKCSHRRVY